MAENISIGLFWMGVVARSLKNQEPMPKAACLHLLEWRHDIAKILPKDADPYACENREDPIFKRFEKFVSDNWNPAEEPTEKNTAPKLSLHRFYFDAITRARCKSERYGQAMCNHLYMVRPDLSMQIGTNTGADTDMDPFFCVSPNDPKFDRFIEFVEKNW